MSQPITIMFSAPVASVTVTAYDPTFSGNRMEAFNASAVSLGVVPFPGNNRPGTLTIQTGTLSGAISRVVLMPAPLDYVNYSMTVTLAATQPDEAAIDCPTPVMRGQNISCVIGVRSGKAFRIMSLTAALDGDTVDLPVANPNVAVGASFQSSGPAIVSTRIDVTVTVDLGGGETRVSTASASFEVTPRVLELSAPEPTSFSVGPGGNLDLISRFKSPYDAANFSTKRVAMAAAVFNTPRGASFHVAHAASGPNIGLGYVESISAFPATTIHVSQHADTLNPGSWVMDQNGGTWHEDYNTSLVYQGCSQAQYRNILFARFLLHEGLPAIREESHIRIYRRGLPGVSLILESLHARVPAGAAGTRQIRGMGVKAWNDWFNQVHSLVHDVFDDADAQPLWQGGFSCRWDNNKNDP